MTSEEYKLTFLEWASKVKGENVETNKLGYAPLLTATNKAIRDRWYDAWMEEREQYRFQIKSEQISHAIEAIKANGFNPVLKNWDNAHIMATSKNGKSMSYYATTGTITGYYGTQIKGVDEFLRLLKQI